MRQHIFDPACAKFFSSPQVYDREIACFQKTLVSNLHAHVRLLKNTCHELDIVCTKLGNVVEISVPFSSHMSHNILSVNCKT